MHFGIEVIPFGEYADPRFIVELAQAADAAGWEGLALWDHMLMPYGVADPWIALAAAAAVTRRLRLLPAVAALPRYKPHLLARQLASLDRLSGGRAILAAGLGALHDEFTRFGESGDMRVRAEMLDEGLDVLARLWTGETVDFQGKHYTVDGAALLPAPVQQPRIPVWIGGESKRALRRAARWDGWIIGLVDENCNYTRSPQRLAADVAYIREHRQSSAPFEVAVDGCSAPGDTARIEEYAQAGATWWFESLFGLRGTHAEMLTRVKAGPPRPD